MERPFLLTILLAGAALAAPAAAQRTEPLGMFGHWGAFRGGDRCWAVAEPVAGGGAGTRAAVGHRAGRTGGQLHVRLPRDRREGSAVLLRIDGRAFQLVGGRRDLWAADPAADAEIMAAMRMGVAMTVETRAEGGARIRQAYRLAGAASALDAAALGCAGR